MLKSVADLVDTYAIPLAATPTGVTTTSGVLLKALPKVIVTKQPGAGELPVPIVIVLAVSEPLTDTVPPLPKAFPGVRARC